MIAPVRMNSPFLPESLSWNGRFQYCKWLETGDDSLLWLFYTLEMSKKLFILLTLNGTYWKTRTTRLERGSPLDGSGSKSRKIVTTTNRRPGSLILFVYRRCACERGGTAIVAHLRIKGFSHSVSAASSQLCKWILLGKILVIQDCRCHWLLTFLPVIKIFPIYHRLIKDLHRARLHVQWPYRLWLLP